MIDATIGMTPGQPLSLEPYPAMRQIAITERDCELVGRAMTIVLDQCEKTTSSSPTDPVAALGAAWLRDEIKRISGKFLPAAP